MTTIKSHIEFDGDSASQESEDIPPGKDIMVRLRSFLGGNGVKCESVEQRSHYGWEFTAVYKQGKYLVVLQRAGPWLLIVHPIRGLAGMLMPWRRHDGHSAFVGLTQTAIRDGLGCSVIHAYTENEYNHRVIR